MKLRAFTLIELLVVIAIIGLLSSVILSSVNQARYRADDSTRIHDLSEIRSALEEYASSNNGLYPSTCTSGTSCAAGSAKWYAQCTTLSSLVGNPSYIKTGNNLIPGLVSSGAIGAIPTDPQAASNNSCCYLYISNGTDYAFVTGFGDNSLGDCPTANYSNSQLKAFLSPVWDGGSNIYHLDPVTNNCHIGTGICAWAVYTPGGAANGW